MITSINEFKQYLNENSNVRTQFMIDNNIDYADFSPCSYGDAKNFKISYNDLIKLFGEGNNKAEESYLTNTWTLKINDIVFNLTDRSPFHFTDANKPVIWQITTRCDANEDKNINYIEMNQVIYNLIKSNI